jgi:hypothetical protein
MRVLLKACSGASATLSAVTLVEARDNSGLTPLAWGVRKGQRRAVEWLVDKANASLTTTDRNGTTLSAIAAEYGHAKQLWWLLDRLPDVKTLTKYYHDNDNDNVNVTTNDSDTKHENTMTSDETSTAVTSTEDDNDDTKVAAGTKRKKVSSRRRALVTRVINEWRIYDTATIICNTLCWPINTVTNTNTAATAKTKKSKSKAKEQSSDATTATPVPNDDGPSITHAINETLTSMVLTYLRVTSDMFFAADTSDDTTDGDTTAAAADAHA